ncbi:AraC family transcriptional regulator [Sorangium sp. So ce302]|uniref:AraC family transcriptional regulator n=1 Tax=Sorangium sp. So ce302 TaxID=3133297 RepID=UPI003F632A74
MDALSRLFHSLHVESALCTRFEASAPWGHRVAHRGPIKFVLIVAGSCWLRTRALPEPRLLGAHDLFLVLDGEPYVLSDSLDSATVDCTDLEDRRDGYLIRYGGGGARSTLVSVAFDVDPTEGEPLLVALPRFIHLRIDQNRSHGLQSLIELLRLEVCSSEIGSIPIIRRLAEALFISAVRAYLQTGEGPRRGVLAAIADTQLARPLGDMHEDLARGWTIDDLARSARMSRSAFAERFRSTVGQTPLEYLTRIRMDRARGLLREGVPIAEVAHRVGYDSAISFTRAFRRVTGGTPGAYQRGPESGARPEDAHEKESRRPSS